jgi:2,4-dienoyl-CoA reductase (NADPH2)
MPTEHSEVDQGQFPEWASYRVLGVDNVILCTGQEPNRDLYDALQSAGLPVRLIGGADVAAELDAERAIDQGTRLVAAL